MDYLYNIADKLNKPLVIFDLETTGVDTEKDEIVQFYGVRIDPNDKVPFILEFLCKPNVPISDEAAEVHGITNEMVANEPPFENNIEDLLKLFDGADVSGYNISHFDMPIINRQLSQRIHSN